jgi:Na+-driven multidrug efflux pump
MRSAHYFLADSLTGAGFQGVRTSVQLLVAGQNVLLNLWLIPDHGWRGAAWASLASDGMLMIGLALSILLLSRRARPAAVTCGIEPDAVP